jgi:hypothetical protein
MIKSCTTKKEYTNEAINQNVVYNVRNQPAVNQIGGTKVTMYQPTNVSINRIDVPTKPNNNPPDIRTTKNNNRNTTTPINQNVGYSVQQKPTEHCATNQPDIRTKKPTIATPRHQSIKPLDIPYNKNQPSATTIHRTSVQRNQQSQHHDTNQFPTNHRYQSAKPGAVRN